MGSHERHSSPGRDGWRQILVPKLLGHDCPEAVKARSAHYRDLIGGVRPFPGAGALVASAHARGIEHGAGHLISL